MNFKTIGIRCLLYGSGLLLLCSCAVTEFSYEEDKAEKSFSSGIICAADRPDSLDIRSRLQTNYDIILLSRAKYKDGQIELEMTLDEALDLGIPENIYNKYSK